MDLRNYFVILAIVFAISCRSSEKNHASLSEMRENEDKNTVLAGFIAENATRAERSSLCNRMQVYELDASDLIKVAEVVKATNENHLCLVELLVKAKKRKVDLDPLADLLWKVVINLKPEPGYDEGRYVRSVLTYFEIAAKPGSNKLLQQSQYELAAFLSRSKEEREETAGLGMLAILAASGVENARLAMLDNLKSTKRLAYEAVLAYPKGFRGSNEIVEIASKLSIEDLVKYASFGHKLNRGSMADVLVSIQVCPQDIALKSTAFLKEENKRSWTLSQDRYSENSALFRFLETCTPVREQILSVYAQTVVLLGKEPVDRYDLLKDFLASLRTLARGTKNEEIRKSLKSIRPWTAFTDAAKKTTALVDGLLANLQ